MTADDLLNVAKAGGILLEVRGDTLHVDAPRGAVTPEIRDALVRHKSELLTRLETATEFVCLRGGLTVPLQALQLALDLERRGLRMSVDEQQQFQIEPGPGLTDADRASIVRWRRHLCAIVTYNAAHEATQ